MRRKPPHERLFEQVCDAPPLPRAWMKFFTAFTMEMMDDLDAAESSDNPKEIIPVLQRKTRRILTMVLQHYKRCSQQIDQLVSSSPTSALSMREEGEGRKVQSQRRRLQFPVEILHHVFTFVGSNRTLASCCVVNRTWSTVARSMLWKRVELFKSNTAFKFLCGCVSSGEYARQRSLANWDITRCITKLQLEFPDKATFYQFVTSHLFLFPALRSLKLLYVPRWEVLTPLLSGQWENCTCLTKLDVDLHDVSWGERMLPRSNYDSERTKQIFSRFNQISWTVYDHADDGQPIADSAHDGLEVVVLPLLRSPDFVINFIRKCSQSIKAIDLQNVALVDDTLKMLAKDCPNLTAITLQLNPDLTEVGNFVEKCGDRLEYLGFVGSPLKRNDLLCIIEHCSGLSFFGMRQFIDDQIDDMAAYDMDDFILLVHRLGQTLKAFDLIDCANILPSSLIDAFAQNCPHLEHLGIYLGGKGVASLQADDSHQKKALGEVHHREEAMHSLLEHCSQLTWLSIGGPGWDSVGRGTPKASKLYELQRGRSNFMSFETYVSWRFPV